MLQKLADTPAKRIEIVKMLYPMLLLREIFIIILFFVEVDYRLTPILIRVV